MRRRGERDRGKDEVREEGKDDEDDDDGCVAPYLSASTFQAPHNLSKRPAPRPVTRTITRKRQHHSFTSDPDEERG